MTSQSKSEPARERTDPDGIAIQHKHASTKVELAATGLSGANFNLAADHLAICRPDEQCVRDAFARSLEPAAAIAHKLAPRRFDGTPRVVAAFLWLIETATDGSSPALRGMLDHYCLNCFTSGPHGLGFKKDLAAQCLNEAIGDNAPLALTVGVSRSVPTLSIGLQDRAHRSVLSVEADYLQLRFLHEYIDLGGLAQLTALCAFHCHGAIGSFSQGLPLGLLKIEERTPGLWNRFGDDLRHERRGLRGS